MSNVSWKDTYAYCLYVPYAKFQREQLIINMVFWHHQKWGDWSL